MKEERMMILAMLEEGKITSEEAIKLMDALEEGIIFEDAKDKDEDSSKKDSHKNYRNETDFKSMFSTLEDIGSDIGNALSSMFNGLKDFNPSFGFKYNYETITTKLDMDISDIESPSLILKAINDNITIRPTDEDKLLIEVICQYKNGLFEKNEAYFDFIKDDDNNIIFNPKFSNNISIRLNVLLPEKHYNRIVLKSSNGKIDIKDLQANSLDCLTSNSSIDLIESNIDIIDLITKNGRIEIRDTKSNNIKTHTTNSSIYLMKLASQNIEAKTANGKIGLNDINGESIFCKTSNGLIEAKNIDFQKIQLVTSNAKITCSEMNLDKAKEVKLMTSNGSIVSDIEPLEKDVIFDLETSMGNISLALPDLIYATNKQVNLGLKKIVAHSIDYDIEKDHLKFTASTANGSITIN